MAKSTKKGAATNGESRIAQRRAAAKADAGERYVARRRTLVQAAASVFGAKGIANTSIDDIARAAGLDRATLYYYYPNKDELFRDVVIEAVESNVVLAERIAASSDTASEKLRAFIAGLLGSYAQFYPHFFAFLREDPATLPPIVVNGSETSVRDLYRRFDRALIDIIRSGVESGDFRSDVPLKLAAYGILGMLNWTYRWFDPAGPVDVDDVAAAFATLAVEGLTKR
jgi:AcrR family transcriptional regulator